MSAVSVSIQGLLVDASGAAALDSALDPRLVVLFRLSVLAVLVPVGLRVMGIAIGAEVDIGAGMGTPCGAEREGAAMLSAR